MVGGFLDVENEFERVWLPWKGRRDGGEDKDERQV